MIARRWLLACALAIGMHAAAADDRERTLVEAARKEGKVVLYSTLTVNDARVLGDAFERKYGVKVVPWRGGGDKIVQRLITEARSRRHDADVVEMNGPQMEILSREKLLATFDSPVLAEIPPAAIAPHRQYVADRLAFYVLAYNTNLVKPAEAPETFEDLLQPRWRGKLAIEPTDVVWFAAVVKAMGEAKGIDYFRRLAATQPQMRAGHILVAELVAAGEIPVAINAYNNNIETLAKKGAPVAWKALQPAFGRPSSIGVAAHAPHPHAAALFTEFVLSRQGQLLLQGLNRVPSSRAVESPLNRFDYRLIDPAITLDEWDKWSRLWSQLFLGGKEVKAEE